MINKIKELLENKNSKNYPRILSKYPDLLEYIDQQTAEYNCKNLNEKLYILLVSPPTFKECNKKPTFNTFEKGYRLFCGTKKNCQCARKEHSETLQKYHRSLTDQEKQQRIENQKQTNLKKYGVENTMHLLEIREKLKATNQSRYGADYPLQSESIKEKIKATNQSRYGTDYPLQNLNIQQKSHQTAQQRYGMDYMKTARQAFLDKNDNQNPFVVYRDKIRSTLEKKYGVDHPSKSKVILEGRKQKELKKYNVSNSSQRHWKPGVYDILTKKENFENFVQGKSFVECLDFLNVDDKTLWAYHDYHNCDVFKKSPRSKYEEEIAHWLDSLYVSYKRNTKIQNNKTVDFLIENKIAIEFNGLYTHSVNSHYGKMLGIDRNYHYNKFLVCEKDNIFLYTIFEDEWIANKNAFKNKIKSSLGLLSKGDSARKCTLKYIDLNVAHDFLNAYHIQGAANGSCYLGGYDSNNTLVAVMVFKKIKESIYELNRFANDENTHAGLFTRMLNKFEKDYTPNEIISFSDNRYSNGDVYKNNGFVLDYQLPPGYSVTNYKIREHKFNWRKSRIASRFNIDISGKTEWQLTQELGWDRIWDCGKIRWVKKIGP